MTLSDQTLIDMYWRAAEDSWAIPDEVMIRFGRAVIEAVQDTQKVRVYHADDWLCGFDEESTSEAWWIELELGHIDPSGRTTDFLGEVVLSLSDTEAMNLSARLVEMVGLGRARSAWDWKPVALPERDRDLLKRLLKGIAETWGEDENEFPDWRENEYARGQLELVIETCRVVTDEEYGRGDGDIDLQRDRITHWIRKGMWR